MRKAEATPGRTVYYGPRDDLRNGRDTHRVRKAIILAVGPYTEAIGGCGSSTIAVHAPDAVKRDRVVIAVPREVGEDYGSFGDLPDEHRPLIKTVYAGGTDREHVVKSVMVWSITVLGSLQSLMTVEEFDIKATNYRLAADEWKVHQERADELDDDLTAVVTNSAKELFPQGSEVDRVHLNSDNLGGDTLYVSLWVPASNFDALPEHVQEAIRLLSEHRANSPKCDHPAWKRRVRRRR